MDRDLFLAILAMDSYNRGYGFGIDGLAETGTLGTATLLAGTEEQKAGWEAAGFYAIAFGIGAGQPFSLTGGLTDQARLTIEFYRAVAGANANPFAANITTTGHSLGGGLVRRSANDNSHDERKAA